MTAPAVVSWAARLGRIHLEGTPFAFLGYAATPWIVSLLALVELVTDQLPKTPSRKAPPGFIARLVTGGLCGAALGASAGQLAGGLVAGVVGAVAGTLGGYEFRARLARAFGKDLPAALIEDLIAVGGGLLLVSHVG
ncbi:MAG TPA: DUF4126 domain-containing protein [Thermoanaerobaculia bacterium]|nr:DUF4126 domain-containing protein [Thermoanaerobaculia bacterium]